ncbi:MAG TPA: acyltransferase [Rhodanobacteraceae bacterium]|nr:acyltransferase [Rhodanobacteraceae bacterium]
MSEAASSRLPHFAGIDVLRGLAVLAVVAHHVHLRFLLNHFDVAALLPKPIARVVFWSGYYGVIVFFVVSGFLIANLSMRRWSSLPCIEPRAFYVLRFARIFPCLIALLAVLSILHLAGFADYAIDSARASLPRAIGAALAFHFNWLEGTHGYLPGSWDVLWSLSIEEAFYFFFPLVCIALRNERVIMLALLVFIVVGPFSRVFDAASEPWDEYAYLSCMDGIAFGCLAAMFQARRAISRRALRIALAAGLAMMLLVIAFRPATNALGLVSNGLYITVLEAGTALVLLAIAGGAGERWSARGFFAALGFVGRRSYEIYLTHMFVVFAAVAAFKAMNADLALVGLWYAAAVAISIALGDVVARGFSFPMNRAIRRRWAEARPMATGLA